jgi:hypothetical protein
MTATLPAGDQATTVPSNEDTGSAEGGAARHGWRKLGMKLLEFAAEHYIKVLLSGAGFAAAKLHSHLS